MTDLIKKAAQDIKILKDEEDAARAVTQTVLSEMMEFSRSEPRMLEEQAGDFAFSALRFAQETQEHFVQRFATQHNIELPDGEEQSSA